MKRERSKRILRRLGTPSPLAVLTNEQLLRALAAARAGEPEPSDVREALRHEAERRPAPEWVRLMSDQELMAEAWGVPAERIPVNIRAMSLAEQHAVMTGLLREQQEGGVA
jgi:hypothetical protein